ncbi:MAG: hypothetical protein H0V29_11505 [Thermoleophilaceae bacterium]|nr:hypothetical protein [Thermoleophilaceae bacterium]
MAHQPIRVAILAPCYFPEVHRGGERIIADLADGLLKGGYAPEVITSHPGRRDQGRVDGVRVIRNRRLPDLGLADVPQHVPNELK